MKRNNPTKRDYMRKLLSITAITVIALVAFVPTASAWKKTNTVITLDGVTLDEGTGTTTFGGVVTAAKKKCMRLRLVTVYRKQPGLDPIIGRTHSYRERFYYPWVVAVQTPMPYAKYYARMTQNGSCTGGRTLGYFEGPPQLEPEWLQ